MDYAKCGTEGCAKNATEFALYQPSAMLALDGGWSATMRCGDSGHSASDAADAIRRADPDGMVLVLDAGSCPFSAGYWETHRTGEL
jgi:hypothetical protein